MTSTLRANFGAILFQSVVSKICVCVILLQNLLLGSSPHSSMFVDDEYITEYNRQICLIKNGYQNPVAQIGNC